MNKLTGLNGGEFTPPPARISYDGVPVVTTEMLAEFYETDAKIISQNFNRNKERFDECKHYYKLEGDRLKDFICILQNEERKNSQIAESVSQISAMTRTLYLWTKQGAARHAKMLETEKAWKVFEILEDTYFTVVEEKKQKREQREQRERVETPKDEMSLKMRLDYFIKLAELAPSEETKNEMLKRAATLLDGKSDFDAIQKPEKKYRKFRNLTLAQIEEIRRLYHEEHKRTRDIAKMFNIAQGSVWNAINQEPII